jgi:hypothetical protein
MNRRGRGLFLGLSSGPQARRETSVQCAFRAPDLDRLRRQAKEQCDASRNGDPTAAERFARHHPSAHLGKPAWPPPSR